MSIGSVSAETDESFLFDCFVHHPAVEAATNLKTPGMILAGRTGSGKTAVVKYIERGNHKNTEIEPAEMAMSYVVNSDIINFLQNIGADLDLFFQLLWKHVLCIEFIRLKHDVKDANKSRGVFDGLLKRFFGDERRKRSLNYLREWEGKFWINMDENIKEIVDKYARQVAAEAGIEMSQLSVGGKGTIELSTEKKIEISMRARKIVDAGQLAELSGVIDILAQEDEQDDRMMKYFILMDRLDDRWVDDSVRFRLIRALIECLKAFRKIHHLKIVIALRSDILERVVQETADTGFQREKYDDLFIRMKWNKKELRELVEKRINLLFKRQYSGDTIGFDDVFPYNVGQVDPFEYMIERTLMRPRDIITFVNECLHRADGQYEVSAKTIREAEAEFSRIRRQALEQEWQSAFPTLRRLFDFMSSRRGSFGFQELINDGQLDELAMAIGGEEEIEFDPVYEPAAKAFDEGGGRLQFAQRVVEILYRVGAVGIKLQPQERFWFSHIDQPVITPNLITSEARIRIHPMLHRALNIAGPDRR